VQTLDDPAARAAVSAERAFARRLGGSCQSPIAAFAELDSGRLTLRGLVAEPDGSRIIRDTIAGPIAEAEALGDRLAERVLTAGARELLERLAHG
jgi:hydroxymethylbilane synthase